MKKKYAILSIGAIISGGMLLPLTQKTMAESTNELASAFALPIDDKIIKSEIRSAIQNDERFEDAIITVSVDDGVTTFAGSVPSLELVREASQIAYDCGSTSVINSLRVITTPF